MFSSRVSLFSAVAAVVCAIAVVGDIDATRPHLNKHLRVKQHRAGAKGDLVDGEEHLTKTIMGWAHFHEADSYEICMDCIIDDASGIRTKDDKGTVAVRV